MDQGTARSTSRLLPQLVHMVGQLTVFRAEKGQSARRLATRGGRPDPESRRYANCGNSSCISYHSAFEVTK